MINWGKGRKMSKSVLRDKSFEFAIRMVNLYAYLSKEKNEFVLSKQLLRSGTSIGAMVRESEHAESKPDFVHKLAIAQKECNESLYWLELLNKTNYVEKQQFESINNDATELIKLLTASIKTVKKTINH